MISSGPSKGMVERLSRFGLRIARSEEGSALSNIAIGRRAETEKKDTSLQDRENRGGSKEGKKGTSIKERLRGNQDEDKARRRYESSDSTKP